MRLLFSALCVLLPLLTAGLTNFTQKPESSYTITEGDTLTIYCTADSAVSFYHWQRNGVYITPTTLGFELEDGSLTISRADHTLHNGNYSCTLILEDSETPSENFTITVCYIGSEVALRRLYDDCVDDHAIAYIDSSLTLECVPPEGSPPINVTWYREGAKIRQRDNPSIDFSNSRRVMEISPLAAANTGHYHCAAANCANKDSPLLSDMMHIMVTYAPDQSISIIDHDRDLVAGEGLYAEMECRIVPPVDVNKVEWYLNGRQLTHSPDEGIRFVQMTHSEKSCINTLHLDSVTDSYTGIYECRQRPTTTDTTPYTPVPEAQRELVLAALVGPLVVEATPSKLVAPGNEIRLVCRLGDDAVANQNNVPEEKYVYCWTHNSSTELGLARMEEGGRVLMVPAARLQDSGLYECAVNSPPLVFSVIRASINITVEASPATSIQLAEGQSQFRRVEGDEVYVELGASVTLLCSVNSSLTRPTSFTFTWLPDSQVGGGEITSHPTSSTLTLPRLTPPQLTDYHCAINDTVHNLMTEELSLKEVQVPYVRNAIAGVQGAEFANGTNLELLCEVRGGSGGGELGESVRWVMGDSQLTNQTNSEGEQLVEIVTNGNVSTLTIYGVTTAGTGIYECVLENNGTECRRKFDVFITVLGRIEYTSNQDVTVTTGERVQFDCFSSGIPEPTIGWLHNSLPVQEDDVMKDLGNGSLLITSVSQDHAGSYYCIILNDRQISQEFTLTVSEEEEESGLQCGSDFSHDDCVILLSGGAVAVSFLLMAFVVFLLCVCVLCHRWRRRSPYDNARDIEMKRVLSSRASSHRDNGGAATNCSETAHPSMTNPGYGKGLYPTSFPVTSFDGALLSEMQRSITPPAPSPVPQTPGTTGVTDSMSSSDDQSSLTATLPNYPREQLKLGEELGEGEFGPVIVGVAKNIVSHEDTTQVVVKVLVRNGDGDDQFQPDLALVDFANQMKIDYEHVACILGLCTDIEPYYVIYEYLDQGDLKKYLLSHRPVPGQPTSLTPHSLSRIVLQVADGMAFLFSQRIIHGDLAARNCLISSEHHVKIADLGIGHDLYQTDYYDNGTQLLPIRWMPPELLVATGNSPAFSLHSDVWSFGVLCWEVFVFGELPYEGLSDEEVLEKVPQGCVLAPPIEGCPDHMTQAMMQCWKLDPETRPHFSLLCMDMNITGELSHIM